MEEKCQVSQQSYVWYLYIITDKWIYLNNSSNINSLFYKQQEEAEEKIFLHEKDTSSRFLEVIIHTPEVDMVVLAFGYARSVNCELIIKIVIKDKNRIISISRIVNKLNKSWIKSFISMKTKWWFNQLLDFKHSWNMTLTALFVEKEEFIHYILCRKTLVSLRNLLNLAPTE